MLTQRRQDESRAITRRETPRAARRSQMIREYATLRRDRRRAPITI